jgi:hypothetical protein
VKVDFYGDDKPTWALVLLDADGPTSKAHLILDAVPAPVVWSEGPGDYRDVYEETGVLARNSVIVLAGYESWAILYAWDGNDVVKLWISD